MRRTPTGISFIEAGRRILRPAVIALVTGERRYIDGALRQIECLYDESAWPDWRDVAHLYVPVDLRTGMFARDLGLAYDWMHHLLTDAERAMIIDGLDRRAIKPFWEAVDLEAWCVTGPNLNNWQTVIVGGMGTCAMGLGGDHPDCDRILDYAVDLMTTYHDMIGPDGESNESPGYASAMGKPADFFTALRYHTRGGDNRMAQWPYPQVCYWMLYNYLPPGRMAAFGDTHIDAPPRIGFAAATADATQDGVLQAFYEYNAPLVTNGDEILDLLWYNPELPADAAGLDALPTGRAYAAHSACVSSRTGWNLSDEAVVVYGKAGHGREGHGNHDAGQLCIDAYGKRLIVDVGILQYPADFFGPHRYRYYNASAHGHNVLVFANDEMKCGADDAAAFVDTKFDRGAGRWSIDLAPLYEGVESVTRTVVHVGHVVAVLDEAVLPRKRRTSLRWHTIDRVEPASDGSFTVADGDAALAAHIVPLDDTRPRFLRDEHAYAPPFNRDRLDNALEQKRESYVEARAHVDRLRWLTLFAVAGRGEMPSTWQRDGDAWTITTAGDDYRVTVDDKGVFVVNASTNQRM